MEKIININLQGRVIPIEETAYNSLKQYIDSLRSHFANEEGNDEIINDIENRIAELLSYRLKQGTTCINSNNLNTVINSIGRLEDIEAAEGEENKAPKSSPTQAEVAPVLKGRFFRNADDKVIAGVCSGIAIRMGVDPVIVRILFVLLFGALFWIYILLWIIVPSQSIRANVTRRLYRNPDDKVIAGVCGGLAVYFNTASWVPRLIFVFPFFIGILSRAIYGFMWHWHGGMGLRIFTGSFGSTLFILYIILWIALPFASSATDKLEMRGEKIDLNSIKAASQANTGASSSRQQRSGLGRVIGILFKAFFMFIAGVFALSFFGVLIGLVFSGFVAMPFTSFILDGWGQNMLAWSGIILFLGIPLLALITWIVRRLIGVRSHRHYLGYVFAGLWLIGLVSIMALTGLFIRNFSSKSTAEEAYPIHQPSVNKLYINVSNYTGPEFIHYHYRWFDNWDNDGNSPFHLVNKDSLWLNTVKVDVAQSADSLYHIYETKISRGETSEDAKNLASHISFNISQQDSIIILPAGFTISNKDKFRNQQVLILVEVPVGKEIHLSNDVDEYSWFNINVKRQRNFYIEHHWNDKHHYYRGSGKYIMTSSGLKNTGHSTNEDSDYNEDNDED
jgi:phage shock protein PspC (stress-responsive transcriptional regulator)